MPPKKKEPKVIIDEIRANMARNDRRNNLRASIPVMNGEHIDAASEVQPVEHSRIEWVVARLQTGRLEPTYIIKWEGRSDMTECRPPGAMAHARQDIRHHGERVLTRDLMEVLMRGRYPYNVSARFTDQGVMLTPDHRLSDGVQRPPRISSCTGMVPFDGDYQVEILYENGAQETINHQQVLAGRMHRDVYYYGPSSFGAQWLERNRVQWLERRVQQTIDLGYTEGVNPKEPGAKEFLASIAPKNRWENVDW